MPTKTPPKPKAPIEPRQFGPFEKPHWFQVEFGWIGDFCQPFNTVYLEGRRNIKLEALSYLGALMGRIRVLALNARDAHYQLSIQMDALGWTEGYNWRVTMICPEEV